MNDSQLYLKAMYGEMARHVPAWVIVQDMGKENGVIIVGASRSQELRYQSESTHQLIIGELIVRPHLVVESNHFRGHGASGLLKSGGYMEEWAENGNVIFNYKG